MSGRVLLTGASSFTGVWIAEALARRGWSVIAPLRRAREAYEGVRADRVRRLAQSAELVFERPFGTDAFLALAAAERLTAVIHHAADVEGYRDPAFDAAAAFGRNVAGAPRLLEQLADSGAALLLTGSVFEAGEGSDPAHPGAVTPYGLSKTLTSQFFAHHAAERGLRFARLVIPSPYGAFEERRFGWHLFRSWAAGETPQVRTPLYVRDHLPAPALAEAYADALHGLTRESRPPATFRPSGWIATQGAFARRTAAEAEARLGRPCPVDLAPSHPFAEPYLRVNSEPALGAGWDEQAFWDGYVGWYQQLQAAGRLV